MAPRGEDADLTPLTSSLSATSTFSSRIKTIANSLGILSSTHDDDMFSQTTNNTEGHVHGTDENCPLSGYSSLEMEKQECQVQCQSKPSTSPNTPLNQELFLEIHSNKRKSFLSPEVSILKITSSSASKDETSPNRETKSVKFQSVYVRTFHRILGDHPCCTTGLPLTFGWKHCEEKTMRLDEYETLRCPRRCRQDMRLNDETRRDILSISIVESSGDDDFSSLSYDGQLLTKIDLKRAERKTFRSRQVGRRRVNAQNFFACPKE